MSIVDPRKRYDDLLVTRSRERLAPEEFREEADSEPATIGWVVLGFVFDGFDRVLLVDQPWAEGWMEPGGVPKPGESLSETVVREIREETGIKITPVRPHAIDEFTFVNKRTGEASGWTTAFFEADAETTEINSELGLEEERIDDADWFDSLPTNVFHRELTEAVYQRCLSNRRS